MIPLDIFLKSQHNISKKLDAWLMLIASDNMEQIWNVINAYPEFGEIYYQVFQFRRKVEELMNMYSDALRILDANTVKYMIEQQAEEIEQQKEKIDQLDQEMQSKEAAYRTTLSEKEQEIERLTALLEARDDNVKNT